MSALRTILSSGVWIVIVGLLVGTFIHTHWVRVSICPKAEYERDCTTRIGANP